MGEHSRDGDGSSNTARKRQRTLSEKVNRSDGDQCSNDNSVGPNTKGDIGSHVSICLTDPDVLDCCICFETLTIPVFQCENGHIACSSCCTKLANKCPSCSSPIGYNRCRAIEKVLEAVTFISSHNTNYNGPVSPAPPSKPKQLKTEQSSTTGSEQVATLSTSTPVNTVQSSMMPSISESMPEKSRRGPTQGLHIEKRIRKSGAKLVVDIPENVGRPVGLNASAFVSKVGLVVRSQAPLAVKKWADIPDSLKTSMFTELQKKFIFDITKKYIKDAVDLMMARRHRDFRHQLRVHFNNVGGNQDSEEAKRHKPSSVFKQSDWNYLCDHFGSDEMKKKSEKSKANRAKLTCTYKGGSLSFPARQYKQNKMVELQQASQSPTSESNQNRFPLTDEDICDLVLGKTSGHVEGWGPLPEGTTRKIGSSPATTLGSCSSSQNNEKLQQTIEQQQATINKLTQQVKSIESILSRLPPEILGG